MKNLLLFALLVFSGTFSFAQISFDADTVYLVNNGTNGSYENTIAITTTSGNLDDLRWEQIERTIEPLVWSAYMYTCDTLYFPFSVAGPITTTSNIQSCSLGANITNLEGDLPRGVNQLRLRVTSVSDPDIDKELTYILDPVPVSTKELLPNTALQVFPNPIGDKMQLTIDENLMSFPAKVRVINPQGKVENETQIQTVQSTIETNHLARGIYFVHLESAEGILVKKVLK